MLRFLRSFFLLPENKKPNDDHRHAGAKKRKQEIYAAAQ
jgi:hypothetical protein